MMRIMTPQLCSARDWFAVANVRDKIQTLPHAISLALSENAAGAISRGPLEIEIARDVTVVKKCHLPDKPGLSTVEGQARLLHDLGSIELQAMELGFRTLVEYPDAPRDFREQLAEITMGEGRHLELCLNGLNTLDFEWGHWSVHTALLQSVAVEDSLLDRILIVHRYLEGSGLDAGEAILRRLNGTQSPVAKPVMQTIRREEVDHVLFGSRWYRQLCNDQGLDPSEDFSKRIEIINRLVPRRERIDHDLRRQAGFTDHEISVLERIGAPTV
jgi:uncharacterized ferritin-like protein (DUF455 family)